MSYTRVIPRDFFNEAKLLKCMGQLALIIHDGVRVPRSLTLEHETPEDGFQIEQDGSTGALYCANVSCFCAGRVVGLRCPYNNKDAYPLQFIADDEDGRVFKEDGSLSNDFRAAMRDLAATKR